MYFYSQHLSALHSFQSKVIAPGIVIDSQTAIPLWGHKRLSIGAI
jgi:hypothetical protein